MKRAGFWSRAAAMTIDIVIVSVLAGVIDVLTVPLMFGPYGPVTELDQVRAAGIWPAAWLVYFLAEAFTGATLGKLLLRLRVVRADGAAADGWTRLLRYSTKHLGFVFWLAFALTVNPIFQWLGGMMNSVIMVGCLRALGEDRVAWHDIWCHTAVVVRERAAVDARVANPDEPLGAPPPT